MLFVVQMLYLQVKAISKSSNHRTVFSTLTSPFIYGGNGKGKLMWRVLPPTSAFCYRAISTQATSWYPCTSSLCHTVSNDDLHTKHCSFYRIFCGYGKSSPHDNDGSSTLRNFRPKPSNAQRNRAKLPKRRKYFWCKHIPAEADPFFGCWGVHFLPAEIVSLTERSARPNH